MKPGQANYRKAARVGSACVPPRPAACASWAGNVTIGFIADTFSEGTGFGRPMIDQTGLRGAFDFNIEFTPERKAAPPAPDSAPDDSVLLFQDALREQLGIMLESKKGPLEVIVVDHIEHPTEN